MPNRSTYRLLAPIVFLHCLAAAAGQTLARPGWAGSGLKVEPWWTHAVLYELDPHRFSEGGLREAAQRLDYLHSLGVDGITLAHVQPEAAGAQETVDPAVGTLEDFDDLVREASRSGIRVLLELDPGTPDLGKTARFWLGHGVGGISLKAGAGAGAGPEQLRGLRAAMKGVAGQRILVAAAVAGDASSVGDGADLMVTELSAGWNAAALRPVLARLSGAQLASLTPVAGTRPESSKLVAALLLATRSNTQLVAGQEIGLAAGGPMPWGDAAKPARAGMVEVASEEADPESVLNWYRRLIDLHHGNGVIRSGLVDFLDRDAQNSLVWVMRKPQVTPLAPALVVACNLSDKPVTLSLTDDLRALHLRGSFLRTLARSDHGLGGVGLNAVTLPPFGVYIGELRF